MIKFDLTPLSKKEKERLDKQFAKEIEKSRDEYLKDYLDKYKDIKFERK